MKFKSFKNRNERAMLSKLRISAHKRAIEGGRYINISKHERICTASYSCEVKDEQYFLLYSIFKSCHFLEHF